MFTSQAGRAALASFALAAGFASDARADFIVYSNDFQSDTAGLAPAGTLGPLGRISLPTDGGGLASPNQSMWLGRLGYGVAKTGEADEVVSLSVSGLTAGGRYQAAFDLFVGASWDGSAGFYGPDSWRFEADGVRLVDTTFANGQQGVNFGAYSPQRYSDATYASPAGPDFNRFTGADASFSLDQDGNYAGDYAIYRFGRGAGNPVLEFTASGPTAALVFARYGGTADSADEYWALDNVEVAGVEVAASTAPEPASLVTLGVGAVTLAGAWRRAAHRS